MAFAAGRSSRSSTMEMPSSSSSFIPSSASLFSAYASLSATYTLLRQAFNEFVPARVQQYIIKLFMQWFSSKPAPSPHLFRLVIVEEHGRNEIFDACHLYLCHKMRSSADALKVSKAPNEETTSFKLAKGVNYSENFEGINLHWTFHCPSSSSSSSNSAPTSSIPNDLIRPPQERPYFSLVVDKEHRDMICNSYLPFIVQTSKDIIRQGKLLKLCDCNPDARYHMGSDSKHSVKMTHPFTFDKLAVDPEMKKLIMDDLDRFVKRKDYYRRVGKPWKRGYLLYGPPGTGKSSLIAAIANYLKFDIYDLQLASIHSDSSLRSLLLWLPSKSIIVVEDIDCAQGPTTSRHNFKASPGFEADHTTENYQIKKAQMSLAALLNFVDGLWSCVGDERLIVFTTNHKDKLEPALLRPGRMDMHIHMSYLTMSAFKILANNYLEISTDHIDDNELLLEIESLLKTVNATPAEVAEELMRSDDPDTALKGVVELLKRKKSEDHQVQDTLI